MNEVEPEKPQPPKPSTLQLLAPFAIAGVCEVLGIWLLYARPSFWGLTLGGLPLTALLGGVVGAVLVFTLPVCLLILLGARPVMNLSPLFPTKEERAKWREMRQRPTLSDDEFYECFYAGTGIPKEIPIRLKPFASMKSRFSPNRSITTLSGFQPTARSMSTMLLISLALICDAPGSQSPA